MDIKDPNSTLTIGLSREAWGPRFWKILHTLAECSGKQTNKFLSNDEADAWIMLLKAQRYVMPCTLCREHYASWQTSHKFDKLRDIMEMDRYTFLQGWLWECHASVNTTNNKPSPSFEELPTLYPKERIEKEMRELATMFQLALNKHQLKFEDISRWKLAIGRLRAMYGI